jgi:hypothetical protein
MKKNKKIVAILLGLIIIVVSGTLFINRRKYGLTPEDASKIYLQTVTSSYKVIDIKPAQINGDSARCGIVSIDKFNWLNRNNGRADGENIHVFELKKTSKGWYVVSDNPGR